MIAFIPARGGSKGVPWKNIRPYQGKPLIRWTIDAAKESGIFDRIVVSSDADRILDLCRDVETIKRDPGLAQDTTPMDAVVADFLQPSDSIMLLQPTSPLRTAEDIRAAAKLTPPVVSVCRVNNKYLKGMIGDKTLSPIYPVERRQDLPDFYLPNGAIYYFTYDQFSRIQGIPKHGVTPYIMEESLDVDTEDDFRHC